MLFRSIRVYGELGGIEWHQRYPNTMYVKWLDQPTQIYRTGLGYLGANAKAATRTPRPTDLPLLAVRILALLLLGAAFSGPRRDGRREGMVRVFVADASRAADADVVDSVRARWRVGDAIVWFDSAARAAEDSVSPRAVSQARGRIAAGLIRAHEQARGRRDPHQRRDAQSPHRSHAVPPFFRRLLVPSFGRETGD